MIVGRKINLILIKVLIGIYLFAKSFSILNCEALFGNNHWNKVNQYGIKPGLANSFLSIFLFYYWIKIFLKLAFLSAG